MRKWLTILFCITIIDAFSQQAAADFTKIDHRVQFIKPAPPAELSKQLISFCSNDLEKVRAIFKWIADNIDYKVKKTIYRKGTSALNDDDNDSTFRSLDERVAEMVLRSGFAFCDGYARLFKTLCNYAGIRAEIITGYGRVNKSTRRFGNNHTWNAVMIDNVWQLLDVTWASGYISWSGDTFIRHFDEEYFLMPPNRFILEHYPDDLAWTLMEKPPLMPEFHNSPFKQKTFTKYRITSYRPVGGIIEVRKGDTLLVELETSDAERDHQIGSDPFLDLNSFSGSSCAVLSPCFVEHNKIYYTYYVTTPSIEWLYIQYNNDIIMRYRLMVKGDKQTREFAAR